MSSLRALNAKHRHLAMAMLVLALCMKAFIPNGYMVTSSKDTVLTVAICSSASNAFKQMQIVVSGEEQGSNHSEGGKNDSQCAFAGLAKVAIGGADAFLLATAFGFILLLGLAPSRHPPLRQLAYLRPPLRGPPSLA